MENLIFKKNIVFTLLKFITIFFVPNALWYQRFLLFGLFLFICFIEEKGKQNKYSKKRIYLSSSILFFILGLIFYFINFI